LALPASWQKEESKFLCVTHNVPNKGEIPLMLH